MDTQKRTRLNLILHRMSLNRNPHRQLWYPSLKVLLQSILSGPVQLPAIPERYFGEETLQDLNKRFRYLKASYPLSAGLELVVGHSLGGALGLYLAQYLPVAHLVLVGSYLPPSLDFSHINALAGRITLIYQEEDPSIPYVMTQALISKLDPAKVTVHRMPTNNHLDTITPEEILKLAKI